MILNTIEIDTTAAQFDTWLRQLAGETGYTLSAQASGTIRRYQVSRDDAALAEIEALPLNDRRLRLRTARHGFEYRNVALPDSDPIRLAVDGFIDVYCAALQHDYGVSPEDGIDKFTAWVLEDTPLSKAALLPLADNSQPSQADANEGDTDTTGAKVEVLKEEDFNGKPSEFGVVAKEIDQRLSVSGARYPTSGNSPFAIGELRPDANPVSVHLFLSTGNGAQTTLRLHVRAYTIPKDKSRLCPKAYDSHGVEAWKLLRARLERDGWIDAQPAASVWVDTGGGNNHTGGDTWHNGKTLAHTPSSGSMIELPDGRLVQARELPSFAQLATTSATATNEEMAGLLTPRRRQLRLHWGYLLVALVLVAILFVGSLMVFPDWTHINGWVFVLLVVAIGVAVEFVANWRTAFDAPSHSTRDKPLM